MSVAKQADVPTCQESQQFNGRAVKQICEIVKERSFAS